MAEDNLRIDILTHAHYIRNQVNWLLDGLDGGESGAKTLRRAKEIVRSAEILVASAKDLDLQMTKQEVEGTIGRHLREPKLAMDPYPVPGGAGRRES